MNIVGKYGVQVQALLKKAAALDIQMICPLHGPIWRENLGYYIEKYDKWSRYEAEEKGVLIVYGSVYGHTEVAASVLANKLAERGVKGIAMYDASHTHVSELVSEAFKYSNIVVAAPTYNGEIYTPVENWLTDLKQHNLQKRKWSVIENGTWASVSGKQMHAMIEGMKNMEFVGDTLTVKSAVKGCQEAALDQLADEIVKSLNL